MYGSLLNHCCIILGSCWDHLGIIWTSFGDQLGTILGPYGDHMGTVWGQYGGHMVAYLPKPLLLKLCLHDGSEAVTAWPMPWRLHRWCSIAAVFVARWRQQRLPFSFTCVRIKQIFEYRRIRWIDYHAYTCILMLTSTAFILGALDWIHKHTHSFDIMLTLTVLYHLLRRFSQARWTVCIGACTCANEHAHPHDLQIV